MEEIDGRAMWEYFGAYDNPKEEPPAKDLVDADTITTGGTRMHVFWDEEKGEAVYDFVGSRMKNTDLKWDRDVQGFLFEVQEELEDWYAELKICTEHNRNGTIFRAHPNYRQLGQWNDWVMVDWGRSGQCPCEIWCFLDLEELPEGVKVKVGGAVVEKGTYAVVEASEYDEDNRGSSDLFRPLIKECRERNEDGAIAKRQFYLADVESFVDAIAVIPDVPGKNGDKLRYFLVTPRREWAGIFRDWVGDEHNLDDMTD